MNNSCESSKNSAAALANQDQYLNIWLRAAIVPDFDGILKRNNLLALYGIICQQDRKPKNNDAGLNV
jgi:hypothetical protein